MTVFSRRDALLAGLAVIVTPLSAATSRDQRVIAAPDLLAQESAAGYRGAVKANENIFVAIGKIEAPAWVKSRVFNGAVLIRELPVSSHELGPELYVRYDWPCRALVRHFGPMPDQQSWGEPIAFLANSPVAWRSTDSRGTIVTLASLLGPQLLAHDREALALLAQFSRLKS